MFPSLDHYPVKIHFMMHEYVLFASRLASFAYSQVHDECWPVFEKRIQSALDMGKTIEDCEAITSRLFKNITSRLFLEARAAKINETMMNIIKNVADFVGIVKYMRNETDHNAVSKAFKKFRDFQTLKKFLLRGGFLWDFEKELVICKSILYLFSVLRAIHPTGCQWFDDLIT